MGSQPLKALALGHKFLAAIQESQERPRAVLVAVSGGADSVALLLLLKLWEKRLKIRLAVAHVHHGVGSAKQLRFRNRAQKFVQQLAQELELRFFALSQEAWRSGQKPLVGEAALRKWRLAHLEGWRAKWSDELGMKAAVATAHTADDLLETRILRLIRGTGASGIGAMRRFSRERWRPLLTVSKGEVLQWLKANGCFWCEDPSNQCEDALRNWLRRSWLPGLEAKSPGAVGAFGRSLQTLVEELELTKSRNLPAKTEATFVGHRLVRREVETMTPAEKRQTVATFLRELGHWEFTRNHITEILKRLDNKTKGSTFSLLGETWTVDHTGIATSRE